MYSKVVNVLSNSGTGTQDITFTADPAWTPKVAIVQYSPAATSNSAFTEGASFGYGFTDGTNSRCIAYVSEDAVANSDTARIQSNNSLITGLNQTGTITTVDAVATFTSWLSNGMQITWSNAPTTPFYITVTFLGGSDLTNATVGTLMTTTGASCSVSGLGYQPDFGMFLYGNFVTENSGSSTTPSLSIGAAKDSSNQWNQTWSHADASGTSAAQVSFSHGRVVVQRTTTLTGYSVFSSWNAGGFTLNNTDTYAVSHPIYYLVTKGGSIKVGNATEPGSTGDQTITTSTNVKSVFLVGADIPTVDTITASGMWSSGAGDGTTQGGLVTDEVPASDPMVNAAGFSPTYIYSNITAAATAASSVIDDQASLSSVSGTGFVINWNNIGQARTFRYITFGGVLPSDYSRPISDTAISVSENLDPTFSLHKTISEPSISVSESIADIESYGKTIAEPSITVAADSITGTKIPGAPVYKTFDVHFVEFPEDISDSILVPPPVQLTRVTVDKTHKYSIIQQITSTKTHKYSIVAKVTTSKTHKWHILVKVTNSKTHKFSTLKKVALTKTHKYSLLFKLVNSKTHKYSIIVSVPPQSKTHKYNVIQKVTVSKTHKYNVSLALFPVSTTKTHKYHVVIRVETTKTHKYDVLAPVSQVSITKTHKFSIVTKVTKTKVHVYNVSVSVTSPKTHKYNVIKTVSVSKTHKYHVLQQITTSKTHKYIVSNLVSTTKTHKYNLIGRLIATRTHRYDVLQREITTKTHKYHIAIATFPVPTSKTHKYNVIAKIVTAKTHKFSLLTSVETNKTDKYNVIGKVTKSKTHNYNILVSIAAVVKTHKYDLLVAVSTTRTHKYSVLKYIIVTKTHRYNVPGEVTSTHTHLFDVAGITYGLVTEKTHKYNILTKTTQSKTHKYSIVSAISKSTTYKYNIEGIVTTSKTHLYNVIQKIFESKTHIYQILIRIAEIPTKTHRYNIRTSVTKSKTHKYNIIGRIIQTKTHLWNSGGIISVTKRHKYDIGEGREVGELGGSTNVLIKFPERVKIIDIISDIRNLAIANVEIFDSQVKPQNTVIGFVQLLEQDSRLPPSLRTASSHYQFKVASLLIVPEIEERIEHKAVSDRIGIEEIPLAPDKQFQTRSRIALYQKSPRIQLVSSLQIAPSDRSIINLAASTQLTTKQRIASKANLQLIVESLNQIVLKTNEVMNQERHKLIQTLIKFLNNDDIFY